MATLDIAKLFRDEAEKLKKARERCRDLHDNDVRAAGNEVEIPVRNFFQQMLPKRFCVTHGHLIDRNGTKSAELDIIISDNTSIPSLFTAEDGTHYVPVDSVYAVGESKSTFCTVHVEQFAKKLRSIREDLVRPLVKNTFYGGLTDGTSLRDIVLGRPHKYLNPLFSFMVFVSGGGVCDNTLKKAFTATAREDLPGMTALLDKAVVSYAKIDGQKYSVEKYPYLTDRSEHAWYILPLHGNSQTGSVEGNHLAMVYYGLLEHLNQTFLEPPDLLPYIETMLAGKKSNCTRIT